jgi:hypothetical protein
MRIAQPVTTHAGDSGHLVYLDTGRALCLIQRQPGPPVALKSIIGPHVLCDVMLCLTSRQWSQLVAGLPGGEGVTDADR